MQTFAQRWLARQHGKNSCIEERLQTWRELPLELAANVNPLTSIAKTNNFPDNLDAEFYPGQTEVIEVSYGQVKLDILNCESKNALNASREISNFRAGGSEERFLRLAPVWFLQAGHHYYEAGEYILALRAFLNSCRLVTHSDDWRRMRANIGKCFLSLGDFGRAGLEYMTSAEAIQNKLENSDAAEYFEISAVAWEAMRDTKRYETGTASGLYNSTVCSRKAKYLFLNLGDYKSASRCSILEYDCASRWSKSTASKIILRAMRLLSLYGESPLYVLRCLILLLLAVGTIFFYSGYVHGGAAIQYTPAFSISAKSLGDYANALYLAAVTISTLGYGDLSPTGGVSKAVAGVASFFGVFLASLFIIAMQRRYIGR